MYEWLIMTIMKNISMSQLKDLLSIEVLGSRKDSFGLQFVFYTICFGCLH